MNKQTIQNQFQASTHSIFGLISNFTNPKLLGSLFIFFMFAVPTVASAATLRTPPNNLGLVGYWSFEDSRGSTATDFSGNGNDGTLTNMDPATDWVPGKLGTALDFDGSDDYVDIGNKSAYNFDSNDSFSYSIWFKPEDYTDVDNGYIYVQHERSYFLQRSSNNFELTCNINGDGTSFNATPTKGEWHHAAFTYNAGTLTLYYDGQQANQVSTSLEDTTSDSLTLTTNKFSQTWFLDGNMDEVRIYNRALSSSEVKDLYQSGYSQVNTSRELEDIDGLKGWWTMDDNDINWSAGTTTDASGNGNEGTFNGGMSNAKSAEPGRVGQALNFDGSDDYVNVGDSNSLDIKSSGITMMGWVKTDGNGDNEIISKEQEYLMSIENQQLYIRTWGDNNGGSSSDVPKDKWSHVAISWNNQDTADVYIDGTLDETASVNDSNSGTSNPLEIGRRSGSDQNYFDGLVDDVRVYDQVLSGDEISRIYNATRPSEVNTSRKNRLTDGLVGFWTFDGQDVDLSSSTAEVKDVSGNNNDGDAQNGASPDPGKLGQAYAFDGKDDYIEVSSPFDPTSNSESMAVSFWLYPSSGSGTNALVEWDNGAHVWQYNSEDDFFFNPRGDCSSKEATNEIKLDEWAHYVVLYDSSDNEFRWYVDGQLVKTNSQNCSPDTDSSLLRIGRRVSDDRVLDGTIDNIRIYDRALSEDEVKKLYRLGK